MKTEPSDIIRLLGTLAHELGDPTCHALCSYAERGENILNVCHEAIRILAKEKSQARKMALEALALKPPPPMIINSNQVEKLISRQAAPTK